MSRCNRSIGVEIHPPSPGGVLELQWVEEGVDRVEEPARAADLDRELRRGVPRRGDEANLDCDLRLARQSLEDSCRLEWRELFAWGCRDELRQPVEHAWRGPVLPLAVGDEIPGAGAGGLPVSDNATDVIEMPVRDHDEINVRRLSADARELLP